jgi:TonB family protein
MSELSADSPALPPPSESWLPGPKPPDEGWTQRKFYFVLAFVLAFHIALIFLFGSKKQAMPRPVTNVPHVQLAEDGNEFIALGDPTLFARPNAHDLVTVFWRRMPGIVQPDFNWTEPPRYLPPAPEDFGAAFHDYMRSRGTVELVLNFKPEPKLILPDLAFENAMPRVTTMQISGELGQRRLLHSDALPSLPRNDVLAPSVVQAVVDPSGNVASAVVLESNGDSDADRMALKLARDLRFVSAPRLTLGEITFAWHTVPTNSISANGP